MRMTVTVVTDDAAGMSWPTDVPLPSAGDSVKLRHGDRVACFTVISRQFCIARNPDTNEETAQVTIRGTSFKDAGEPTRLPSSSANDLLEPPFDA